MPATLSFKAFAADCLHALRVYARTPGASLLAVLGLAVALAFVSAFLTLYVDLVIRPHPGFDEGGEIVTIGQNDGTMLRGLTIGLVERIDAEVASLERFVGYTTLQQPVGEDREPLLIDVVTRGFFDGIRPRLALGRGFEEGEHAIDGEPVVVISHAFWQREFDGNPGVIGTTVRVSGQAVDAEGPVGGEQLTQFRIVGVMSPELPSLIANESALWMAYEVAAPLYIGRREDIANNQQLRGIARRAAGVSPEAIADELNDRFLEDDSVNLSPGFRLDAIGGLTWNINVQRETVRQLSLFLAGSLLLAVVAAANLSLFLLSRAPSRQRELGIRMAVGATTQRLARQLATEAVLLVGLAAVIGLGISVWLGSALQSIAFLRQARWQNVSLADWRVLLVMLLMVAVLAFCVSLLPVRGLKRRGIAASSRQVSTRANLTQRFASTLQLAIAGAVGAAAVAFGTYLVLLLTADPGYEATDVKVVTLDTAGAGNNFGRDFERLFVERERRREVILAVPGVTAVAFGSSAPGLTGNVLNARIAKPSKPDEQIEFAAISADRQYFEMLAPALAEGSLYAGTETDVMLVNEAAGLLLWDTTEATGESIPISVSESGGTTAVGVLVDYPHGHPKSQVEPRVYIPIFPISNMDFIFVETTLAAAELHTALDGLVEAGALEFAIGNVQRLDDLAAALIAADRARAWLTIGAAALVVLLAGVGFYGTQRYLVNAGKREYAIRAAVGAGPNALARLVCSRGLELGLPGIVVGGLLAFIVAAWLRDGFVAREVVPGLVALGVVGALAVLLLAASLGPALHARRTEPAPLLREE